MPLVSGHEVIVVGASAGGVEALKQLVAGLPADLPAAVFVVLHVPAHGTSVLPRILSRAGRLPAAHARDQEPIAPGRIYVAPPDQHLLVEHGRVRVTRGPRENGHRPAADPLFRSAARAYGSAVVGLVLSGALDDGTAGLAAIKRRGGVAVAQSPADALYPGMPASAVEHVAIDFCLPVAEIAPVLIRLAQTPPAPASEEVAVSREMDLETGIQENGTLPAGGERPGQPSVFGCPECGGVLFELHDGALIRYRCRVGHAWTADGLLAEQSHTLEAALWAAARALEERVDLSRRLARRAGEQGNRQTAAAFLEQAQVGEQHLGVIRKVLLEPYLPQTGQAPEPATAG
jgi:two-component system chemotaxis response regulator CheB